jgi:pyrimidine-specific ribonucleoside hydrolase
MHNHNHNHNHIFKQHHIDPALYSADIAAIAFQTIEQYGIEEWEKAVLTCEMHSHVGVYAILGVKMGLYAREQMNADIGQMHITSLAGSTPPISCFNDGLQVSTGSTLGHGLIEVAGTDSPTAEAIFSTPRHSLHLRLKEEYAEIINREFALAKARYGENKGYWDEVRHLAIHYWAEWNRNDIFEIAQ